MAALFCHLATSRAQSYPVPNNVGLGVAAGAEFSITKLREKRLARTAGNSFAWGFFVDVPLTDTFYVAPTTTLYQMDFGDGYQPVTDVDLAFKFIAPLGSLHAGAGVLGGLTSVEKQYMGHAGVLTHLSLRVLPNVDAFAQFQYKRIFRELQALDHLHGYAGVMFRF